MSLKIKARDGADPDKDLDLGSMVIEKVSFDGEEIDGVQLDVGHGGYPIKTKHLPVVLLLGAVAANLGRIVDRLDTLIKLQTERKQFATATKQAKS